MQKNTLVMIIPIILFFNQLLLGQAKTNNYCPLNVTYFAYNLPIEGANWYVPIKYKIMEQLIDLEIIHKKEDELFIRFKIIKILKNDFKDAGNCNLEYQILTYDEESKSYGEKKSEIEFKFSNGKGKIIIRHPNFPEIISDATSYDNN